MTRGQVPKLHAATCMVNSWATTEARDAGGFFSESLLLPLLLVVWISLLAGCAKPATESFDALVSQQDPIAVGEFLRSEQMLDRLQAGGKFIYIDEVDGYLSALLMKLYPEQHQDFGLRVARLPGENAFALSNGVVVIHLSLLAALENEHQLAFVLAHEFEHINARHGYLGAHLRRSTRVKAHLTDMLTLGSGVTYSYYAGGLRKVNREQEFEADWRARSVLVRAGFDVAEAARFFDVLQDYANPAQLLERQGTHPDNSLRKKRLLSLVEGSAGLDLDPTRRISRSSVSPPPPAEDFKQLRQQILRHSIEEKIADMDFLSALVQLEALNEFPEERSRVRCLGGEIYYQMAMTNPESYADRVLVQEMREHAGFDLPVVFTDASSRGYFLNRATSEYKILEKLQPKSACSTRGLGLVFFAMGQHAQARDYLRKYLRLNPSARDRRYIGDLMATSAAI